jgi:hypothetical protein
MVPERRPPRHDHEQQTHFQEEGDVYQPADQKLLPRLDLCEAIDAGIDVAISTSVRL